MKILMISDVYFPRINGVSTSIATFRRELTAMGHEVALIAPEYPARTTADPGIIRVPSRYLMVDPEDRIMKAGPVLSLVPRLRAEGYDLLHIQTPFLAHHLGIKLSRHLNIPRIESYHTFFEEYLFHYLPLLPKRLMRFAARHFSRGQCNNVDGLVVPSVAMLEVLRGYGIETPAAIIPTGIELDEFEGGDGLAFRRRLGIPPERPTLVHVGRIAHEKNIDFLLRAVAAAKREIPDIALVIAGEGPALTHVKRLSRALGLGESCFFVGYLDRSSDLLDCYRAGDAFIFASRTETQGLVLLESMALGVPVVSTSIMGTRDILTAGKGALVADEDVDDFSRKLITLLRDEVLRARLGAEAKDYVREWTARALAEKMLEFYQRQVLGDEPDSSTDGVSGATVMRLRDQARSNSDQA
jgi:glycosyltransferase involved in cell wall biosynthesis